MNKKIKALIIFVAIILLGFIILISGYKVLLSPISKDATLIEIEIPDGTTLKETSKKLKENNLIKNTDVFLIYAKLNSLENIKSGRYSLNKSQNVEKILNLLNEGSIPLGVKITIPEGFEVRNIIKRLSDSLSINPDKFLEYVNNPKMFEQDYLFLKNSKIITLEGYLFPDTYYISEDLNEEGIIRLFLERFNQIYIENDINKKILDNKISLNEFITMASIVEREAVKPEERAIIAGVFYNRLNINMPLQSCATVQYILKERKPILSIADTKINSPYNTYINKGLPPTPIASPGLDSILATLDPKRTDYIYFVAKGDGGHEFSETYEEHLKAKKKYLGE